MRILTLHPLASASAAAHMPFEPWRDPSRHLPEHEWTHVELAKTSAVRELTLLARRGFDVVVNLCDGARDEDHPGVEVVEALDRLELAYTGAGPLFYDPSRVAMKMAAHAAGVRPTAYVMVEEEADLARAAKLRFPLIVKHPHGYNSVGLTRDSRVTGEEALSREVERIRALYGAALVEEFVEGREFTVLVAEPREGEREPWALAPVEFLFPPGETFKHFDLKWKEHRSLEARPVSDPVLAGSLRAAAAATFAALGGSGYARLDFRRDARGELLLLEVNPNCSVFYPEGEYGSADFILASDPSGPRGFLLHLLDAALRRCARARKAWRLGYEEGSGFGLFARRSLSAGEVAVRYEEQPTVLVSHRHVERTWTGMRRRWFDQYAWPVSPEVSAIWSERPDDWRPINHSCDPNLWLEGLDLVARRGVAQGEELTVDYATFCGPRMSAFTCACGATECRGTVRGTDALLPELALRYRGHLSGFVRLAQAAAAPAGDSPSATHSPETG